MQRKLYRFDKKRRCLTGIFHLQDGKATRRVRKIIGTFAEAGLGEDGELVKGGGTAEKKFDRWVWDRWQAVNSELLQGDREKRARGKSVKGVFQDWIDVSGATKFPGTLELYMRAANLYVETNGDHPVNEMNLSKIDKVVVLLRERGLAPSTVNISLKCYRTFLNWCLDREHISKVPRIKMLAVVKEPPSIMSEDDVQRFQDHLQKKITDTANAKHRRAYIQHQRAFMVLLYTGLRRGVIAAMRWDQINFQTGIIKVRVQHRRFTPKQKRGHDVFIPGVLVSYLEEQRNTSPAEIFLLDDGMGEQAFPKPHALTVAFKRHLKALGMDGHGIKPVHQYRALAATRLRKSGADLETIRGILDHSDLRITAGYFADPSEVQKEAMEKMGRLFGTSSAQGVLKISK